MQNSRKKVLLKKSYPQNFEETLHEKELMNFDVVFWPMKEKVVIKSEH